jgi:hypothetical protein
MESTTGFERVTMTRASQVEGARQPMNRAETAELGASYLNSTLRYSTKRSPATNFKKTHYLSAT